MTAELRHIEAFLAVARLGHFTRAAAALHVSQSALTVQIRQLEAALGVRLFDRNNRRVALTQAGRDLVAPFERISLDVAAVLQHARDLSAHRRGTVTVGALPSVAASVLPQARSPRWPGPRRHRRARPRRRRRAPARPRQGR